MAVDAEGKLLVGGSFGVKRLNTDDTLDTTFNVAISGDPMRPVAVRAIAAQPDGKVVIAGTFSSINGEPWQHVARLTSTGQRDTSFRAVDVRDSAQGVGALGTVTAMALDGDKVIITGNFDEVNTTSRRNIARLLADGRLDPTFSPNKSGWESYLGDAPQITGSATVQLHVSDGQHIISGYSQCSTEDPTRKYWEDSFLLNGVPIQEPQDIQTCNGLSTEQLFSGTSVPLVHGDEDCIRNWGLWDITPWWTIDSDAFYADPGRFVFTMRSPPAVDDLTLKCTRDDVSLVVAILAYPGSEAPAQFVAPRIDGPPFAVDDSFTLRRSLGRRVLDVLGNDWSPPGKLLTIKEVSASDHGVVTIVYNGSAILYALKESHPGPEAFSDQFTYTVSDIYGNEATASVVVTVDSSAEATLITGTTISGMLQTTQPADGLSTVRGGNRYADFFKFTGSRGDSICVKPLSVAFNSHLYLRNPLGEIIASGHEQPANYEQLGAYILEDGEYVLEITSHHPNEIGDYSFAFDVNVNNCSAGRGLELYASGVLLQNNATVDFGLEITQEFELVNTGLDTSYPLTVHTYDGFAPVAQAIDPILPGARRRFTITRTQSPASGVLTVISSPPVGNTTTAYTVNLRGYSSDNDLIVSIDNPAPNSLFNYPVTIPVQVTVQPALNNTLTRLELFAKSAAGRRKVADVANPIDGINILFFSAPAIGDYQLVATASQESNDDGTITKNNSDPVLITVANQGGNTPPVAVDDTISIPVGTQTRIDVLANDYDVDGDSLKIVWVQLLGGGGEVSIIEEGRALRYDAPSDSFGSAGVVYGIRDARNGIASAIVTIYIINQTIAITYPDHGDSFNGTLWPAVPALSIPLVADAKTSYGAIAKVEFFANNVKIGEVGGPTANPPNDLTMLYRLNWKPKTARYYKLTATALSDDGIVAKSAAVVIGVNQPENAQPPEVSIDNIVENQILRQGIFEVRGMVTDPDPQAIVKYRLELFKPVANYDVLPSTEPEPNPLKFVANVEPDGEGYHEGAVAAGLVLGNLDLTGLPNGAYVLRLTGVDDYDFTTATTEVRFVLDSQLKVGQLTFSEQDLVIPVAGIPITVVRTYDSFNTERGTNFGAGWSLSINDLQIEFDEEREYRLLNPDQTEEGKVSVRVGGGRNVTLTLPDGRRATFAFTLQPGKKDENGTPCQCFDAKWIAPPGVYASLVPIDINQVQFLSSQWITGPFWAVAGPQVPFEGFDFSGFYLTNVDGAVYEIRRPFLGNVDLPWIASLPQEVNAYGKPRVTKITTPAGDRIEIGDTTGVLEPLQFQIKHFGYDAGSASTQILVKREENGNRRISKIYDPIGVIALSTDPDAPAAVKYEYYTEENRVIDRPGGGREEIAVEGAIGNLKSVHRLVNRSTGEYETTTYYYKEVSGPHLITDIVNARGDRTQMQYDAKAKFIGANLLKGTPVNPQEITQLMSLAHEVEGRREIVSDALGNRTIHEYDERGNVVRTINTFGDSVYRSFDPVGNVKSETDSLRNTTTYGYDDRGNRTEIKDPLENTTKLKYNHLGQVLTAIDPNSTSPTARNEYDQHAQLKFSWDAYDNTTEYNYYTASRQLQTIKDPLGNVTEHEYYTGEQDDPGGRRGDLKSVTVKQQLTPPPAPTYKTLSLTTYEYDANGNRTKETIEPVLPAGEGIPESIVTTYEYDGQNRLVKTIDAENGETENGETETVYDPLGKVAQSIDRYGRETSYQYDDRGNLSQTKYPDGTIVRMLYDANNRLTNRTDQHFPAEPNAPPARPNYTATHYDPLGRPIRTERVKVVFQNPTYSETIASSTATSYDAVGRVIASIDARGYPTLYGYDAVGRRTSVTNALGEVTSFAYDKNGNQTFVTNALGRFTAYEYDNLNRRIKTIHPRIGAAEATTQETRYDVLSRRIAEVDADGVETGFGYDALGRLTSVTNDFKDTGSPSAFVTTYGYDEVGNLRRQTDANNHTTAFAYDKLGRRTERTLPGDNPTLTERVFYDSENQETVKVVTDFKGQHLFYLHDKMDRLIAKGTVNSLDPQDQWRSTMQPVVKFTYYPNGLRKQMIDAGTLIEPEDEGNPPTFYPTEYEYDDHNRLTKKKVRIGGFGLDLYYEYDRNGNLTRMHGQNTVHYEWDAANRLKKVLKDTSSLIPEETSYTYDAAGNLDEMLYGNGLKHTYVQDEMNRLTSVTVKQGVADRAFFDYNPSDRPLALTGQRMAARETVNLSQTALFRRDINYFYNPLRRLNKENITIPAENTMAGNPGGEISYETQPSAESTTGYDLVGNRRSRIASTEALEFAWITDYVDQQFDAKDRLLPTIDPTIDPEVLYDANGNTLRGGHVLSFL